MTDLIDDSERRFWYTPNMQVLAECPHCGREEGFDAEATARAWLSGHIQTEHADELPDYDGTGDDE